MQRLCSHRIARRIAGIATAALIQGFLASTAVGAGTELVVFSSGQVLRVENFRVVGEMAAVELPGGEMRFPLTFVDRVVANETELFAEERRTDPGFGANNGTNAAPGAPDGEPIFETAQAEEPGPAEHDPARSISGRILNESGDPVDGIEVRALAIRLFQAAEGTGGARPEAQSRSDRDGVYRFEQLAQGEYGIRAIATERYTSARTVVRTGADEADLILNYKRDVAVYGTVTSTRGEPLEDVAVTRLDGLPVAAITDQDGNYRLQLPGGGRGQTYRVGFELEGYGRRTLSLTDSDVLGRSEVRLDTRLEPLESLVVVEGTVSNPTGAPVAGETVFLVGERHYQATTDEAGRFRIPEVDAHATYRLWVSPSGPYRKVQKQVQVGAEGLTVDVVLESQRSDYASLSGRMIDVSGNPVPNFSLWLRSSNSAAREPVLVTGDSSGAFSVPEAPLGPLTFTTVSDPRLAINGLELSPEGVEHVELILDSGGYEIRGRVLDRYGNPVAAPRLTLEWSDHRAGLQSLSRRDGTADAYGFFVFKQVGPGLHSLSVTAPGFESAQIRVESPGNQVVQLQANHDEGGLQQE